MAIDDTDIILSVRDAVKDILEDADLWTTPFTVYGASEYRSRSPGDEPTWPYAFLIAAREPIEVRWLPVILIDGDVSRIPFQLGNVSRRAEMRIHVIGESQGDVMRLVSRLSDASGLDNLALYDHAAGDEIPSAYALADFSWQARTIAVPEKWTLEGTVKHWVIMENSFIIM